MFSCCWVFMRNNVDDIFCRTEKKKLKWVTEPDLRVNRLCLIVLFWVHSSSWSFCQECWRWISWCRVAELCSCMNMGKTAQRRSNRQRDQVELCPVVRCWVVERSLCTCLHLPREQSLHWVTSLSGSCLIWMLMFHSVLILLCWCVCGLLPVTHA